MDPIARATLSNVIPGTPRVGETAPLAPASAVPASSAAAANAILSSTLVDISPLGQFLSGVALSRRQLLALQGATEQASAAHTPVNVNDDLLALARQLTESFAQLQTSGIDASQLATAGEAPGSLAQRYDLLAGDGTTDTAAALAQDGSLLTQAGLARIGIDLRNEDVDAATLQAAYAADRNATLDALQQGTEVLAQVGAVLAQRQGAPVASVVQADLAGDSVAPGAVAAGPAAQAAVPTQAAADQPARAPLDALGQRQLEVRQQLETEELSQDLQEGRQQEAARVDAERAVQQSPLQARAAAGEAARAQLAASDAQLAAQAAGRAQSLARTAQSQAEQDLAATAQAQLAQQNAQAQELAAQNAGMAVPPPSSQDPSVAAAIAAYNLNNLALNPGLTNRQALAGDAQKPLVTPVAPVEPVKPVQRV